MSEYVKIKRRLYDELLDTRAKYVVLCEMLEAMEKVYRANKPNNFTSILGRYMVTANGGTNDATD